jgi:4-hydroxybenzoyl-CoA thioesterase
MANDAVLTLAQEARIRFLKAQGYTEINIEGLGIIMTDAAVVYLSEAFHGEVLEVDIALSDFSRCGMDMLYHFREKCSQRAVCVVKTGILFFDYTTRKVKSIPETFLKRYLPDN